MKEYWLHGEFEDIEMHNYLLAIQTTLDTYAEKNIYNIDEIAFFFISSYLTTFYL